MIGQLTGEVTFSDGKEVILLTPSGVGYQIFFNKIIPQGKNLTLFISQVIKEDSHNLFGFDSPRSKYLFVLLLSVKGVGSKTAYGLLTYLEPDSLIEAITLGSMEIIKKVPGVGEKTASQIMLDLKNKIQKVKIYSLRSEPGTNSGELKVLEDTILACKELGLKEAEIIPLAQKIMRENKIQRAEQLVHLVLRGL
jgi:Holliday junction DNA helicase RuvA